MGCFCQASMTLLEQQLATLAPDPDSPDTDGADAFPQAGDAPGGLIAALSAWLAARALPASPWQPDPDWLDVRLPMPRMDAGAVATTSALVELRTQVLAQFGLDLLLPGQASGFSRIVATMNARLAGLDTVDLSAWTALAQRNDAIDQVALALRAGLFAPPPDLLRALSLPGGLPVGQWAGLLAPLRRLAPLIAAAMQLGVTVTDTAPLADALRVLARISLPALAASDLMAGLGTGLAALARLQASLGCDPARDGLAAVAALVQRKQAAVMIELAALLGADPLAALPTLPVVPSSLATADVVRLAIDATPLAMAQWQVPDLPAVRIGLATCAFTAQIQAAFGTAAVRAAPCGGGCDAAALLRGIGPG